MDLRQPYARLVEAVRTFAVALDLRVLPTTEGGRRTSLLGGSDPEQRFTYRPNWGFPGWADGEQTAGPVFGFSEGDIAPGSEVRAVIVGLFPEHAPWADLTEGSVLRMYEGSRVCGIASVVWVRPTTWRPDATEEDIFRDWLNT